MLHSRGAVLYHTLIGDQLHVFMLVLFYDGRCKPEKFYEQNKIQIRKSFSLICTGPEGEMESSQPTANEAIVSQLYSMGFSQLHCKKAAINTSNVGVEEAMNWLLSHMDDPGNGIE